jgi:hypothetical protein
MDIDRANPEKSFIGFLSLWIKGEIQEEEYLDEDEVLGENYPEESSEAHTQDALDEVPSRSLSDFEDEIDASVDQQEASVPTHDSSLRFVSQMAVENKHSDLGTNQSLAKNSIPIEKPQSGFSLVEKYRNHPMLRSSIRYS